MKKNNPVEQDEQKSFFMVVVENSSYPPKVKHETYQEALNECLRISKKENQKAFVLKAVAQVEQIPKIDKFKP